MSGPSATPTSSVPSSGPSSSAQPSGPTAATTGQTSTSPSRTDQPTKEDSIGRRIAAMSLRDRIRQLVVVGFGGTTAPDSLIKTLHPGGLIYFGPNLVSTDQIRAMSEQAQRTAREHGQPLLIMTDQEGGPVTRLPGTEDVPGGAELDGNTKLARLTAVSTAHDLTAVGINLDLAPVADVNTVGNAGVIGDRSFSSDPTVVSRMVRAQICGYHAGGVAAAAKHWPGHGSTTTDSHLAPAQILESRRTWRRTDLPPFVTAVHEDVDVILLGHLSFPAMDPSGRPATISAKLNRDLLRKRLGFEGVEMTDALNMKGITDYGSTGGIAVRALRSGIDMLLMPPHPSEAVREVVAAVHDGKLSVGRIDTSVRRILTLKQRLGLYQAKPSLALCP